MPNQGKNIEAVVTLDLRQFQTQITKIQGKLDKLSESLSFKSGALVDAKAVFTELENIMKGVVAQAKEINNAFANISAVKNLLENLNAIQRKVKDINLEMDKTAEKEIKVANAEQEVISLKEMEKNSWKGTLDMAKRELRYMDQIHNAELKIYDDIIRRYEAEGKLATTVNEQLGLLAKRNAEEKSEIANLDEQLMLQKSINALTMDGSAESIKQAESLMKQLDTDTEIYTVLQEQIALEKEKLSLLEMQDKALKKQTQDRKTQNTVAQSGNKLDKMGYLPSRIGSMALTMWGFNEIMDIYEKSMQNMNAFGSQKTYEQLMKSDNRYLTQTKQDVRDIDSGVRELNKSINETYKGGKSLQQMYQKVDMQSVGANAMDTAFKYGVQAENLDELAEVMAIYGSEFVRQGRSQEDSILAVNDALDGEIRRLKEVGIDREDLEAKGWKEGDTMSMIKALREIAEERGYDVVAQKITNLSDAITVLEIRIAQDLVGAFKVLEPFLTEVAKDFITVLDTLERISSWIQSSGKGIEQWMIQTFGYFETKGFLYNLGKFTNFIKQWLAWAVVIGVIALGIRKIYKSIGGLLGIFKKAEDVGGGIAKDTGGIAKTGSDIGFKQGFKNEMSKLGKNLGVMARLFVELAVAMFMAWALIREGMALISEIGWAYEQMKPQFEQGVQFLKEYGESMLLISGAFVVLSYVMDKIPNNIITSVAKGMAITMGLIAEAIGLLILPLISLTAVGGLYNWQQSNIESGMKVIRMVADALHIIEQDDTIGWFIVGFVGLSAVLGMTADIVAIPLAVGIATTLLLVAEAIGLLVVPLGAIALLGATASTLGEDNINQGAEAIRMIGRVLKVLADAMVDLLIVDIAVLGVQLSEFANKLFTGKTGLEALVDEIIPNLTDFIKKFNALDMGEPVDQAKVQAIVQMSKDIPPLFSAIQTLNNALGTGDVVGNAIDTATKTASDKVGGGLQDKLDQLYEDAREVMNFATKMGSLNGGGKSGNANAITQTANAIGQLKAKLDLMINTVSSASGRLQSASNQLGRAITTGFQSGSSGFASAVVQVVAKGISEVQSRYQTWYNGGKASAQKLADGFKTFGNKLKTSISTEMGYALDELDNYKDDFYNKGAMLGESLVDGFKSKGGLDQNSPAKITKSIREELGYSMEAIDVGRQMLYRGGQALGSALANGYAESNANLRTNVDVLASKSVSNEQLQATARNIQANTNKNKQVPQISTPIINIDMSNSTIIGIQDLDARIRASVDKAMVEYNSPNGAVGY